MRRTARNTQGTDVDKSTTKLWSVEKKTTAETEQIDSAFNPISEAGLRDSAVSHDTGCQDYNSPWFKSVSTS